MPPETIQIAALELVAPYADLLPRLTEAEYDELREDIRARGVIVPIVLDESNNLIDGYHRAQIASELKLTSIPFEIRAGLSADERSRLAEDLNLHRRHLSTEQRRAIVAKLRAEGKSARQIAKRLKVDEGTVRNDLSTAENSAVERVTGKDGKGRPARMPTPDAIADRAETVKAERKAGKSMPAIAAELGVSVGTVAADAKRPTVIRGDGVRQLTQTTDVIARGAELPGGLVDASNLVHTQARKDRRDSRIQKIADVSRGNEPLDARVLGRFPVIVADPPWKYSHIEVDAWSVEEHYPTLELERIGALPVSDIATDDAVLFLWTTSPKVADACRVIDAWGFRYVTCSVWDKVRPGMGYWFRQRHELLLVATRGEMPPPTTDARPESIFREPRTKHSRKPEVAYQIIERMFPTLPKLELFARTARSGWQRWGNEANTEEAI